MNFLKKLRCKACVCSILSITFLIGMFSCVQADSGYKNSVCESTHIINKLPFKISTPGEYIVDKCLTVACDGGICVDADDVTIRFCSDGLLLLKENSVGIKIDDSCNVNIVGSNFEGYHNKSVDAISIKVNCVKNLHIDESKSSGISQVLITKQSKNVVVEHVCWENEKCDAVCLITFLETDNTHVLNSNFKITPEDPESESCDIGCHFTESSSSECCECCEKPFKTVNKAIYLGNNINNWKVSDCVFEGFDRAICAKSFCDGTLTNSTFYSCHEGLKVNRKGFVERFLCKNCRAQDSDGLSWFLSLDGQVFDSSVENLQLTNTHIYCFQCNNCVVNNIEIDSAIVSEEAAFGIQCGGPRGPGIFNLTQEDKRGCTNCRISNIKCRMASLEPNSILFMAPIVELFCQNCEITDSQVLCDGGASRAYGIGILENYCSECAIRRCSAVGPCVVGIHICDILDLVEFCRAPIVENCEVQDAHYGINLWRCHAGAVQNCKAKLSKIGIFVSEDASSAIVQNCHIVENEIGFLYQPLLDDVLLPPTFTPDPVEGEPVNGILLKNTFAGNTIDIIDNSQDQDLNIESNNKFF